MTDDEQNARARKAKVSRLMEMLPAAEAPSFDADRALARLMRDPEFAQAVVELKSGATDVDEGPEPLRAPQPSDHAEYVVSAPSRAQQRAIDTIAKVVVREPEHSLSMIAARAGIDVGEFQRLDGTDPAARTQVVLRLADVLYASRTLGGTARLPVPPEVAARAGDARLRPTDAALASRLASRSLTGTKVGMNVPVEDLGPLTKGSDEKALAASPADPPPEDHGSTDVHDAPAEQVPPSAPPQEAERPDPEAAAPAEPAASPNPWADQAATTAATREGQALREVLPSATLGSEPPPRSSGAPAVPVKRSRAVPVVMALLVACVAVVVYLAREGEPTAKSEPERVTTPAPPHTDEPPEVDPQPTAEASSASESEPPPAETATAVDPTSTAPAGLPPVPPTAARPSPPSPTPPPPNPEPVEPKTPGPVPPQPPAPPPPPPPVDSPPDVGPLRDKK